MAVVYDSGAVGGQSYATPCWACERCGARSIQGPEKVRHNSWCEEGSE